MAQLSAGELMHQAALARELAPALCAPTGCAWYHGAWPALRALGLVASPHRNAVFFTGALREAATLGDRRVLVSGAADAGMLELVLGAYGEAETEPDVTVLDRCPTPVRVSADFAERAGVAVTE